MCEVLILSCFSLWCRYWLKGLLFVVVIIVVVWLWCVVVIVMFDGELLRNLLNVLIFLSFMLICSG